MRPPLVVAALLLATAPAWSDTTVAGCGAVVPAGETGILAGNLDCGGGPVGVTLAYGATLRLNGFSIRDTSDRALDCTQGRCTVVGGPTSEITECGGSGIVVSSAARLIRRGLTVSDLRIADCGGYGIDAPMAGVVATRVETSGHGATGTRAWSLRGDDVTASGNGLHGFQVRSKLAGLAVTAEGNGINGVNALEGRVRILGVTVRANVHAGIAARRLHLDGGEVSGNNVGATGIDLYIGRRPWVRNVVCSRSVQLIMIDGGFYIGPSWHVCTDA